MLVIACGYRRHHHRSTRQLCRPYNIGMRSRRPFVLCQGFGGEGKLLEFTRLNAAVSASHVTLVTFRFAGFSACFPPRHRFILLKFNTVRHAENDLDRGVVFSTGTLTVYVSHEPAADSVGLP
ncbi:hypothetical protein PO124_30185 [Bacillus licheniformis]|nr:hypothetical protein [Bacillus licheniformis]